MPGWDVGLVGVPVGSRVMLSLPPADGYGSAGNTSAGITSTDTLVFVVDIVQAITPTTPVARPMPLRSRRRRTRRRSPALSAPRRP